MADLNLDAAVSVSIGGFTETAQIAILNDGWNVQMELSGRSKGWTDVTSDVRWADGVVGEYGLSGNRPDDLVANSGTLSLSLDNSTRNSGGLVGYYSPGHSNCRSGFDVGVGVRVVYKSTGAPARYKWVGIVDAITPVANIYGQLVTRISAVDWMDYAAMTTVTGLSIQLNQLSSALFSSLIATVPVQPRALEVQTGKDTYPYAFDDVATERRTVLTEIARLCQSGRDRCFIKGDTKQGGTLTFESRATRAYGLTNVDTFQETSLAGLAAVTDRSQIINRAQAVVVPRRVDAAATTVLYKSERPIKVPPNSTQEIFAPYRDPSSEAERVGGTAIVAPVATTDYTANSEEDGTGTSLTANVSVSAVDEGNGARTTITTTATVDTWVTLQIRGKGVYAYRSTVLENKDTTSIALHGERAMTIDMPYQSDTAVAEQVAQYTVVLNKNTRIAPTLEIRAHDTQQALMNRALAREISDRIGVVETVTGTTTTRGETTITIGYFINRIRFAITPRILTVTWSLQPADANNYWRLGVAGATEVDSALVAFGQILGHADITHEDTHTDTAHGDTAHGDVEHGDVTHVDQSGSTHDDIAASHTDSAHSDSTTAHVDVDHEDVPHEDSHADAAHGDAAHDDTEHTDVEYQDIVHGDHDDGAVVDHDDGGFHADGGHEDQPLTDEAYQDTPYGDTAHVDTAHDDSHSDVEHTDVAHEDTAYSHTDVSHGDTTVSHTDHDDATHGDITEVNIAHTDDAHADTAHVDTHADVEHTDEG